MNVQVRNERVKHESLHGGHGFSKRNEAGEKVLDFAASYDNAIINTYIY